MKTLQTKAFCLGLLCLLSSALFAHSSLFENPAKSDVPMGYWVVESHPKQMEAIVRYYNMEKQLVHIEKVPVNKVNLTRRSTINKLNEKARVFAGMYKKLEEQLVNPAVKCP
jgi:hypothetical protein